ncbi:hypothetical protein [Desulfotruncus arcticus]|nr:hypothetical protein [Desulfotruncus arcticus]
MAMLVGFLGQYPGCRCMFRTLDINNECRFKCPKRVDSCEICHFGGNKGLPRKTTDSGNRRKRDKKR